MTSLPTPIFWIVIALGVALIGLSLSKFSKNLTAVQGSGVALGLFLIVVVLVPGSWSVAGASHAWETAKRDEVVATGSEIQALSIRLDALEKKISVLSASKATQQEKEFAIKQDAKAKADYTKAAARAVKARKRLQCLITEDGSRVTSEDGVNCIALE